MALLPAVMAEDPLYQNCRHSSITEETEEISLLAKLSSLRVQVLQ